MTITLDDIINAGHMYTYLRSEAGQKALDEMKDKDLQQRVREAMQRFALTYGLSGHD